MDIFGREKDTNISGIDKSTENQNEVPFVEKENQTTTVSSPVPQHNLNKSVLSPNRRKSGSPLSIIRNFASLSNRGSPTSRASPRKGSSSPFSKFFAKVS